MGCFVSLMGNGVEDRRCGCDCKTSAVELPGRAVYLPCLLSVHVLTVFCKRIYYEAYDLGGRGITFLQRFSSVC